MKIVPATFLPTFLLSFSLNFVSSLGEDGNGDAATNAYHMDKKKKRHLQSVRSRTLYDDGVPYDEGMYAGNVGGDGGVGVGGGPGGFEGGPGGDGLGGGMGDGGMGNGMGDGMGGAGNGAGSGFGDVGGNVGGGGVVVEPIGTRRPDGSIVVEGGLVIPPDLRPEDHSNNPGRFEGLRGGYYSGNFIGSRSGGMMGMSGSRYSGNIYYGGNRVGGGYYGNIGSRSGGMSGSMSGSRYGSNRYYNYAGNVRYSGGSMMGSSKSGGRFVGNYNPNYAGNTGNLYYSGNIGGNVGKGVPSPNTP